jgi:hypothetical protein
MAVLAVLVTYAGTMKKRDDDSISLKVSCLGSVVHAAQS